MTSRSTPPRRRRLIEDVAGRIPWSATEDCVRVAVDGVDGSGKTMFADELATVLRDLGRQAVRVSVDGFHNVRAVRYRRGRDSPEGFWLDSYDYGRLFDVVLRPLGPGGSRRYRPVVHDVESDRMLDGPFLQAPAGAVLVLDGLFLHRDELAALWDLSVFLDVPFDVTAARMAERDGSDPDPDHPSMARYVAGQGLYAKACAPKARASLVIDNTTIDEPFFVATPGRRS